MNLRIVPADGRFVEPLVLDLRPSDLAEITVVDPDESPRSIIARSLHQSDHDMRWACLSGDRLIAVFGCAPYDPGRGICWMLATTRWNDAPKPELWRLSREYVDRMNDRYPMIFNLVDDRNAVSRRWLSRLGFQQDVSYHVGPRLLPFTTFLRYRHV